jgi:sulfite exporter TauE/SafE
MLFFGIGTLPALLAIAGFGFGLARFLRKNVVQKASGIIVIILGIWSLAMPIMHSMGNHNSEMHNDKNHQKMNHTQQKHNHQ